MKEIGYGAAWDAAAKEDAKTFILDSGKGKTSDEVFWSSGKTTAQTFTEMARGKVVADYGCGIGRVLVPTAAVADKIYGLDVSGEMLTQCAGYTRELGNVALHQVEGNGLIPLPDDSVDLVYSFLVLQHMRYFDAYRMLRESKRILRPGGQVLVTFPNLLHEAYSWGYRVGSRGDHKQAATRMRYYTEDHARFMLEDNGYEVEFLSKDANFMLTGTIL